jgi:hypothetical protein
MTNEHELEIRFEILSKEHFELIKKSLGIDAIKSNIVDFSLDSYKRRTVDGELPIFLLKERLDFKKLYRLGARLSFGSEIVIPDFPKDIIFRKRNIRGKERYSKKFADWTIDLTKVNNDDKNGFTYELEFELNNNFNKKNNIFKSLLELFYNYYPIVLLNDLSKDNFRPNMPHTLEQKDLQTIATGNYLVTEKSNGERKFCLTSSFGSVLFSRILEWEHYPLQIPSGCLLDCELISGKLLVFDILFHEFRNVQILPFSQRLNILGNIKGNMLELKMMLPAKDIKKLSNCDEGIIFTNVDGKYSDTVFKWKRVNTIDVLYRNDKNVYARSGKTLVIVPDVKISLANEYDDKIVEIYYDAKGITGVSPTSGCWKLHSIRTDKILPNSILAVGSVLETIKNPITFESL